jgi:tetratricopeptide (TPR) repeat protein
MFNLSFTNLTKPVEILPEISNRFMPHYDDNNTNTNDMTTDDTTTDMTTMGSTTTTMVTTNNKNNPTICLNMIVCNESKIITRLLNSVLPIIDYYCICDTGSTDDTVEIITQFFKNHNIPGIVFTEPFQNFGYNRTISLQKCAGKADYVLLLDADMTLVIGPMFEKSMISAYDFLYICQGNIYKNYHCNVRIIRNHPNNSYKGVTHEYLLPVENYKSAIHISPDVLFINDIGDGGCKKDKYTRDIKLLTQGIVDEPNNSRYYFYLANSYNDVSEYTTAIDYYMKRLSFGGWIEEVWYSWYRVGLCYFMLKEYEKAIWYWLEALQVHPNRVENLFLIIHTYIQLSNSKHILLINLFINIALEIINNLSTELKNTFLFLENNIYTYDIYILKLVYNNDPTFNPRKYFTKILNNCLEPPKIINVFNSIWSYKDYLTSVNSFVFTGLPCFHSCIIPYNGEPLPREVGNKQIQFIIVLINSKFDIYKLYIDVGNGFTISKNININPQKLYNLLIIGDTFISYKSNSLYMGNYNSFDSVKRIHLDVPSYSSGQNPDPITVTSPSSALSTNIISDINIIQKPKYMYTYLKENTIVFNWFPLVIGDIYGNIIHKQNTPNIFNYVTGGVNTVLYNNQYWTITQIRLDDGIPMKIIHMFIVFDINFKLIQYSNPILLDNNCFITCHSLTFKLNELIVTYLFESNIKMSIYNIDIIKQILNDI